MSKLLVLSLIVFASSAQARPSTYNLTCQQAQTLVDSKGSVVLNYGYNAKAGNLYALFITPDTVCPLGYKRVAAPVQTRDVANCHIGYVCVSDANN